MEDQRGLQKIMDLIRFISVILIGMNIYYFGNSYLAARGFTRPEVDNIFEKIQTGTGIFTTTWTTKLIALLLLALSVLGTRGNKSEKISLKKIFIYLFIGAFLFFGSDFLLKSPARYSLYILCA